MSGNGYISERVNIKSRPIMMIIQYDCTEPEQNTGVLGAITSSESVKRLPTRINRMLQ